jgi:hypothetical protein
MSGTALAKKVDPARESMDLVKAALAKDVDVDKLEKLIAMRDADLTRRARQAFHDAMTEFHRLCPTIPRNRTANVATRGGTGYAYQYADLDTIQNKVDPVLSPLGLRYGWDTSVDGATLVVVCTVSHVNGHESPSSFSCPTGSSAGMSEAQKHAAALTFAKRQTLCNALGLKMSGPDVDGADTVPEQTISEKQAHTLSEWLKDTESDEGKFLAWAGVDALELLPASRYAAAMTMLERKAKK